MNIHESVAALAAYAVEKGLIEQADFIWAVNSLCQALGLDSWEEPAAVPAAPLEDADFHRGIHSCTHAVGQVVRGGAEQ